MSIPLAAFVVAQRMHCGWRQCKGTSKEEALASGSVVVVVTMKRRKGVKGAVVVGVAVWCVLGSVEVGGATEQNAIGQHSTHKEYKN